MSGEVLAAVAVVLFVAAAVTWLKVSSMILDRELRISKLERDLRSLRERNPVSQEDAERASVAAFAMGVAVASSLSSKREAPPGSGASASGPRAGHDKGPDGLDLTTTTAVTTSAGDL